MRILVTGGSGFIGKSFCSRAAKAGHEIAVMDIATGGDVTSQADVMKAVEGCDAVVHLAAFLGVKNTEQNPLKTLETNINGTRNVLEACVKADVKKVVFSSSSEVYGNPESTPIKESDRLAPVSVYGFSKAVCEQYIKAYKEAFGLGYAIVRYFNVYGREQRADFVIPRMMSLAVRGHPVEVYGSGGQIRAFTHVSDAAEGTLLALENGKNDVFNIGNDTEPVTISDLACRIVKAAGSGSTVKHISMEESDRSESREIFKRVPSIIKAKEILGYRPKKPLDEGLGEVAEHMRKSL